MQIAKVIIVDDDELVIKDLNTIISWKKHGFSIVGTARNGRQALKLIERHQPKVLITDIKMPVMDGLELIESVRKRYPHMQILIITSYDEFAYAKRAIEQGVSNYILKTEITSDTMLSKMNQIYMKIEEQSSIDSITLRQELQSYWEEDVDLNHLHKTYKNLYKIKDHQFLFLILSEQMPFQKNIAERSKSLRTSANALLEVLSPILLDEYSVPIIFTTNGFLILGMNLELKKRNIQHGIKSLAQHFFTISNENALHQRNLFYWSHKQTITAFKDDFFRCLPFLEHDSAFSKSEIVPIQDYKDKHHLPISTQYDFGQLIIEPNNFENKLESIKAYVNLCCQSYDMRILNQFYSSYCSHLESICHNTLHFSDPKFFHTSSMLLKWLFNAYSDCITSETKRRKGTYSLVVENALTYMDQNLNNHTITSEKIAMNSGLSSGRLGVLFKQEIGKTINEVLTELRIKKACYYLLNTNLKIYEISNKCGYKTSQYFSHIFYEKTNKRPLEFRKDAFRR